MAGLAQSIGWPASLGCLGNWFGFGQRGFIMGLWTTSSPVGSVLGSIIAGLFVDTDWSLSFKVLSYIGCGVSLVIFVSMVPRPEMVKCLLPQQNYMKETIHEKLPKMIDLEPETTLAVNVFE